MVNACHKLKVECLPENEKNGKAGWRLLFLKHSPIQVEKSVVLH